MSIEHTFYSRSFFRLLTSRPYIVYRYIVGKDSDNERLILEVIKNGTRINIVSEKTGVAKSFKFATSQSYDNSRWDSLDGKLITLGSEPNTIVGLVTPIKDGEKTYFAYFVLEKDLTKV